MVILTVFIGYKFLQFFLENYWFNFFLIFLAATNCPLASTLFRSDDVKRSSQKKFPDVFTVRSTDTEIVNWGNSDEYDGLYMSIKRERETNSLIATKTVLLYTNIVVFNFSSYYYYILCSAFGMKPMYDICASLSASTMCANTEYERCICWKKNYSSFDINVFTKKMIKKNN